jgi:membrane protein
MLKSLHRRLIPFLRAYQLWLRADCVDLSAAFAYHTLQSLFPAILIALSFASRLLGRDRQLVGRLVEVMTRVMPESALPFFLQALEKFTRQGFGAGILGAVLLVLSANNIYLTLQRGADRLWWNRPYDNAELRWLQMVQRFIVLRLKAFLLLVMVALVMVVDQFISSLRFLGSQSLHDWLMLRLPVAWQWLGSVSTTVDVLLSVALSFLATLILLWMLPSRRIPLRHLFPGALLISLVLTLMSLLLGRSLVALGLRFQAFGVVGGVLVLTLWVWMVGLILYYGQCLSVVLAGRSPGWRSTLSDVPSRPAHR